MPRPLLPGSPQTRISNALAQTPMIARNGHDPRGDALVAGHHHGGAHRAAGNVHRLAAGENRQGQRALGELLPEQKEVPATEDDHSEPDRQRQQNRRSRSRGDETLQPDDVARRIKAGHRRTKRGRRRREEEGDEEATTRGGAVDANGARGGEHSEQQRVRLRLQDLNCS